MNLGEYDRLRRKVTTGFGDFDVLDVGRGRPVVFVHGLFVSAYLWRGVIAELRDERRCIAYNLPGHGRTSVAPDQDLSLDAQAEMLRSLCDTLDLDAIDLVANDTGGAIAQVFAARHPGRVRSLALTNCEARDVLPSPHELGQMIFSLATRGELAPVMVQMFHDHDMVRGSLGFGVTMERAAELTSDDIRGYLEQNESLERAREIERFVVSLHVDQLVAVEAALKTLDVPTIVVWGTADPIFGIELAHWLRATIPGCREVVEVPGGRLFWPGERPEDLVAPLRRFWAANAAPAGRRPEGAAAG